LTTQFTTSITTLAQGGEGCTPGFWKNNASKKGASQWIEEVPTDLVKTAFSSAGNAPYTSLGDSTLLQGLSFKGGLGVTGAAEILLRAAIAAKLNIEHPDIDYGIASVAALQDLVNDALDTEDRDTILALASTLDGLNNAGCPISQNA
jgi:hypothetical protein